MPKHTIRNLDEATKARLRLQAARHERSMEEEAPPSCARPWFHRCRSLPLGGWAVASMPISPDLAGWSWSCLSVPINRGRRTWAR